MLGTPEPLVTSTPLVAVVIDERVLAAEVYKIVLAPPKVERPVPPFPTETIPVKLILGVKPPLLANGADAPTEVTAPIPEAEIATLLAEVI